LSIGYQHILINSRTQVVPGGDICNTTLYVWYETS